MSAWKVIFATIVIFTAGLITGGVGVRQLSKPPKPPAQEPFLPWMLRREYVERMSGELDLTTEQKEQVAKIVRESQERVKIWFDLIAPEMREELRRTREAIRAQLTPEQATQFDALLKKRQRRERPSEGRRPPRNSEERRQKGEPAGRP